MELISVEKNQTQTMTDREMLMMAYGALVAYDSYDKNKFISLIEVIEEYLFTKYLIKEDKQKQKKGVKNA